MPDNTGVVTPYLCVKGAARAIEFYKHAFGATEAERMGDAAKVTHAEIRIYGAPIYLADEFPDLSFLSPQTIGGSSILIHLMVPDVDALTDQAVSAGATLARPVADQDYGMRNSVIRDPFGYSWMLSSVIKKKVTSPAREGKRG